MTLPDGKLVEADKTYRVAGWASVNLEQGGRPVWDVVATHLRRKPEVALDHPSRVMLRGVDGNPGYRA
jgi:sulfur-oxidizing protein SoxB